MKNNVLKKMLMVTLTVSLLVTPVMTAGATSNGSGNGGSSSSSSSSSSSAATVVAPKTSEVTLSDGTKVKTTIAGSYASKSVEGIAVATPAAEVNAALGLAENEKAYVTVADSNYGPKAKECVDNAAAAYGAEVYAVLDIFMGKETKGQIANVTQAQKLIEFKVSTPKGITLKAGYEWAVICVMPGGKVMMLPNWSTDGNTVQFFTDGFGVFAFAQVPAGSLDTAKVLQYNQANGL